MSAPQKKTKKHVSPHNEVQTQPLRNGFILTPLDHHMNQLRVPDSHIIDSSSP